MTVGNNCRRYWFQDFKTSNLLFERLFSNSLLSCCTRVRQVYVRRKSTHEVLYPRRTLGHKISGFAVPKTFRVDNVDNNVRYIPSCQSIYVNSPCSNARNTKMRTITCSYIMLRALTKKLYSHGYSVCCRPWSSQFVYTLSIIACVTGEGPARP